jgi:hypothetical protein
MKQKIILFFIITMIAIAITNQSITSTRFFRNYRNPTTKKRERKNNIEKQIEKISGELSSLRDELETVQMGTHPEKKDCWQEHIIDTLIDKITTLQERQEKLSLKAKKLQ